jgi:hypothetical protein
LDDEGRIGTLSHFSALKILDTTSEMWWNLLAHDLGSDPLIQDDQRFCQRLPPSLQTLILHTPQDFYQFYDDSVADIPHPQQIQGILIRLPQLLPHLKNIFIGNN